MEDLEQGDVAETVSKFFEESRQLPPVKKSNLSLQDVDDALEELSGKTREEDQTITLRAIAKKWVVPDLCVCLKFVWVFFVLSGEGYRWFELKFASLLVLVQVCEG